MSRSNYSIRSSGLDETFIKREEREGTVGEGRAGELRAINQVITRRCDSAEVIV